MPDVSLFWMIPSLSIAAKNSQTIDLDEILQGKSKSRKYLMEKC